MVGNIGGLKAEIIDQIGRVGKSLNVLTERTRSLYLAG